LPPAIEEVQLKQRSIPNAIAIVASQETKEQKHSLSNSLFKESKKKKRINTFFQTLYSKSSSKRRGKNNVFSITFHSSLLSKGENKIKTKVTRCLDGYLILLITPGSGLLFQKKRTVGFGMFPWGKKCKPRIVSGYVFRFMETIKDASTLDLLLCHESNYSKGNCKKDTHSNLKPMSALCYGPIKTPFGLPM